jgi:hypothetical protein
MFNETFVSLAPINFFQIGFDCLYHDPASKVQLQKSVRHLLPDTSMLCHQQNFAKVWLGWNREGLQAFVSVSSPCQHCSFPDVAAGDSLEFFIDTRDVKTSGFNTRFCHHFFFLPESIDGKSAGEMTRFRTEDRHELCESSDLNVKSELKSHSYTMHIYIPSHCLYGYDLEQFDRMGFTYRINRFGNPSQHFSVLTDDYQMEQQPSLWSSARLLK